MSLPSFSSARLAYRRLDTASIAVFQQLIVDAHIRRFLLDGEIMDLPWCASHVAGSDSSFEREGLGLWLVSMREDSILDSIGFCGFLRAPQFGPELQLLYALRHEFTGKGFATEMAHSSIDYAFAHSKLEAIDATVDEPNLASIRILVKLGFQRTDVSGTDARILRYSLRRR